MLAVFTLSGQEAKPGSANKIEQTFGWMKGNWTCSGTFPRTGRAITTDVHLESTLQDRWLLLRQDDRPPNQFHALTFWGWSDKQQRFTARLLDSGGGDRLFTSPGWDANILTWSQESAEPAAAQRFVFVRKGETFGYHFDLLRDGAWATVDTLDCTR